MCGEFPSRGTARRKARIGPKRNRGGPRQGERGGGGRVDAAGARCGAGGAARSVVIIQVVVYGDNVVPVVGVFVVIGGGGVRAQAR